MKRYLAIFAFAAAAMAQRYEPNPITGNLFDMVGTRVGTTLPSSCVAGEQFYLQTSGANNGLYVCDQWSTNPYYSWYKVSTPNGNSRESKIIVIIGSSVAEGYYASTCANAVLGCTGGAAPITAGLFPAAMVAKGYTVYNRSVAGWATANVISNFYTLVAPLKPDFVVHATGIANEGIGSFATYRANIARLIKMTEGIGAIPVVIGPYAYNSHSASSWREALDTYEYLEKLGVQVWDFADVTVSPGTDGDWIAAFDSGDGTHPNDDGHAAMYSAIPLTFFDVAFRSKGKFPAQSRTFTGSWEWGSDVATSTPLGLTTDRGFKSFTAGAWFYGDPAPQAQANIILQPNPDYGGALRVRCGADVGYVYGLNSASLFANIISTIPCNTAAWNHLAVVVNSQAGTVYFYINGTLVNSTTITSAISDDFTTMSWLGNPVVGQEAFNCTGCRVAEPFFYRSPLTAEQVKKIYSGQFPTRSLEFIGDTIQPAGRFMANVANTSLMGAAGLYTSFTRADGVSRPELRYQRAAKCANGVAGPGMDMPAALAPTPTCVTGTNTIYGVLQWPDADGDYYVSDMFRLPSDWTGTMDFGGRWRTAATSGDIVPQLQTACVADGETGDPAWNTAQTTVDTAKGTTLQWNDFTISSVTTTGCAAGETFFWRLLRNRTHASDTLAATWDLIGVQWTLRRNP